MKRISPQLLAFLQTRTVYHRADLFFIELINGQIIAATTAQMPITYGTPPVTYYPSLYGSWERGPVKTEVSFQPKANSMKLTVNASPDVLFPVGASSPVQLSIPLLSAVINGLFDAAKVTTSSIYWAIGDTPANGAKMGTLIVHVGQIAKCSTDRSKATFDVADMTYLLDYDTPPNIIQSGCRFKLFDQGCTLNANSFAFNNSALVDSNAFFINLATPVTSAPFWNAEMTFEQGQILFTSGLNKGLRFYIKAQIENTQIQLATPLKFTVNVGDTFTMFPGCNKSLTACSLQFNNLIHFGGFPFVPNPETAV